MDEEFERLLADPLTHGRNFARAHWREYVLPKCDPSVYLRASNPVTILTAGCTGAGKTEFSRSLIEKEEQIYNNIASRLPFSNNKPFPKYIIADADDFYLEMRDKYEFKEDLRAELGFVCVKFVEKLVDKAISGEMNLLIDSSFSQKKSLLNVRRSLDHGREVRVFFIYEEPQKAWHYTQVRKMKEGRSVSKEFFAKTYIGSIKIVKQALEQFGESITVQMLKKYETNDDESPYLFLPIEQNLTIDNLDKYVPMEYNEDQIKDLIE